MDKPFPVGTGGRFAVLVRLNTPRQDYPIATEEPTEKTKNVDSAKGQSYVSRTGDKWSDFSEAMPGGNVCLKVLME